MIRPRIILVATALAVLIAAGTYAYLYRFLVQKIHETAVANREAEMVAEEATNSKNEQDLIDSSREKRRELETHFVTKDSAIDFLGAIEALDVSQGTQTSISLVDTYRQKEGEAPELSVTLHAQGSYSALMNELALLESMPYEIEFPSVGLSRIALASESESAVPLWQLSLTLRVKSYIE